MRRSATAPLLGHVPSRIGNHVRVRAEMPQMLVHPEQMWMMRGRDHPDQVRLLRVARPVNPALLARPVSPIDQDSHACIFRLVSVVPVQADERRDADRQQHLMGDRPPDQHRDLLDRKSVM